MPALLRARVERDVYCRLLRNLYALYVALEAALDQHADTPEVGPVCLSALFRSTALKDDLNFLYGSDWYQLPLTVAMQDYVTHLHVISETQPGLLAAHAYVRYLGDLSGGQVLRDRVRIALGLSGSAGTAFYGFGEADESDLLKAQFRTALNALALEAGAATNFIIEANAAFARHIQLFEELGTATGVSA